jgi:hypothetical protein
MVGFSKIIAYGTEHKFNFMVIELLGKNLEYLF